MLCIDCVYVELSMWWCQATLLVVINALVVALGEEIVYARIVPGVGISMAFGNIVHYTMQHTTTRYYHRDCSAVYMYVCDRCT